MNRQRVYFFNRFFWPDTSATAQILTDLCEHLDPQRFDVTVVTSRLNYADPQVAYPAQSALGPVTVRRLWSTRFGRAALAGRFLDYLTIYLSFFLFALVRVDSSSIAVFKTDPPLLSLPGALAQAVRRFRMVAWCQDIFPEVAAETFGTGRLLRKILALLAAARDWSLGRCDRVIVLGEDMERFLAQRGIPQRLLTRIPNWSVHPERGAATPAELRARWGIPPDAFVVGYSGNLGRAHDWETVLGAARLLRGEQNLVFVLCGGGHGYAGLKEAVEREGLTPQFRFLPYQPRDALASSLRVPDAHWFSLKPALTPYIYPSKFAGILEAGRPVIFIGDPTAECARLILRDGLGAVVGEADAQGCADTIRRMMREHGSAGLAAGRARNLWTERFCRNAVLADWDRVLTVLSHMSDC